jgi:hypothetical protein
MKYDNKEAFEEALWHFNDLELAKICLEDQSVQKHIKDAVSAIRFSRIAGFIEMNGIIRTPKELCDMLDAEYNISIEKLNNAESMI